MKRSALIAVLTASILTSIREKHYEIPFEAASLPSGVYLHRLDTENFTLTTKMLMLK